MCSRVVSLSRQKGSVTTKNHSHLILTDSRLLHDQLFFPRTLPICLEIRGVENMEVFCIACSSELPHPIKRDS